MARFPGASCLVQRSEQLLRPISARGQRSHRFLFRSASAPVTRPIMVIERELTAALQRLCKGVWVLPIASRVFPKI